MSSLAGALIPPEISPVHSQEPVKPHHDLSSDVDMKPHDTDLPTKDAEEDEEMADLFGNDDVEEAQQREEEEEDSQSAASGHESDRLPSAEREHRRALEYEEEDVPAEIAVEVKEAEVAFPNIPVPKSSDGDNWVVRMPNFVKVDSKPFHPDTYIGPEQEDEEAQQAETLREKSMSIKLKVENTLRWRWTKDGTGNDRRQSNSRVIRWSDGTLSLRLGKELFDINQSIDTSGGVPRQSFGGPQGSQQTSQPPVNTPGGKSQGLTYLVAQHKRSQVLQAEALVTGYMTLRPTGMQSETHRMLVRAVGQKHNKIARLRMAPDPTTDPEREKMELIKQSAKKSKRKVVDLDDPLGGGRSSRRRSRRTSWSDDEEAAFGGSESDDDGLHSSGRRGKKKAGVEDPDQKRGEYQEDGFVVADESDEDGGSEGGGRKRRRDDDMMEEDPLDKLDAKINEQDSKRRRRREPGDGDQAGDGDQDTEDAMDVESEEEEEEEEEFKVRRVGGTKARRRQATYDDDDDDE